MKCKLGCQSLSLFIKCILPSSLPSSGFALIAFNDALVLFISFFLKAYLLNGLGSFLTTLHVLFWGAGASILYVGYNPRCLRQTGGQVCYYDYYYETNSRESVSVVRNRFVICPPIHPNCSALYCTRKTISSTVRSTDFSLFKWLINRQCCRS